MKHNKTTTASLLFCLISIQSSYSKNFLIFSICSKNQSLQSERMNQFHKLFTSISGKMSKTVNQVTLPADNSNSCEITNQRNIAALSNAEYFLHGNYELVKDSINVRLTFNFTQFLDKSFETKNIKGIANNMNSVIKSMISSLFKDLDIHPNPDEWILITKAILKDEKKYGTINLVGSEADYFSLGKLAYNLGKYEESKDYLSKVATTHPEYDEACFLLGKSFLYFNDYNKALSAFRNIIHQKSIPFYNDYVLACKKLHKPSVWYDTELKRKTWWQGLSETEVKNIVIIMNNLKINGKSFEKDYTYKDEDIVALFKTSILALNNTKWNNFEILAIFTNTDILILENCIIKSDEGIDKFSKLKLIKTDNSDLLNSTNIKLYIQEKNILTQITENK